MKQIARAGIDFLGFTFTNLDMALPGSDGNMLVLKTGIVQAPGLVTTTPAGGSALSGNGYKVDAFGNASFKSCRSSGDSDVGGTLSAKNLSSPLFTPATSKAPCTKGQFAHDLNFEYVCIAPNTWRRAALSDF